MGKPKPDTGDIRPAKGVTWSKTDGVWKVQMKGKAFGCTIHLEAANAQAEGVHRYLLDKGHLPPVSWRVPEWDDLRQGTILKSKVSH